MIENNIDIFKEKIIEYKSRRYFKSFSEIMTDAKKYLKVDYEEEGIFKKKYLIRRVDFGKMIFRDEILICNFLLRVIDQTKNNGEMIELGGSKVISDG